MFILVGLPDSDRHDRIQGCVEETCLRVYKKWKVEEQDPSNEEERVVLRKSLEIRMNEEFAQETLAQQVKNAGKQFSALVSIDLCIVWMWATKLT